VQNRAEILQILLAVGSEAAEARCRDGSGMRMPGADTEEEEL
jgi:hypothetical protein